jgi:hypothetical protein
MSEWQKIETAPKGGERIAGAVWSDKTNRWICMDAYWCRGLMEPKWIFDGWLKGLQPTHWIPLPSKAK